MSAGHVLYLSGFIRFLRFWFYTSAVRKVCNTHLRRSIKKGWGLLVISWPDEDGRSALKGLSGLHSSSPLEAGWWIADVLLHCLLSLSLSWEESFNYRPITLIKQPCLRHTALKAQQHRDKWLLYLHKWNFNVTKLLHCNKKSAMGEFRASGVANNGLGCR